jgi:choline dehydrogenase-like flavoprotein
LTAVGGRRRSAADAYLASARTRPNLEVRGDVLVDRVVLAGTRACGVRSATGEDLLADEVVLAGGAIGTPAILLRSRIERAGIGRNLADHASAGFSLALAPAGRLSAIGLADQPVISSLVRYSSGLGGAGPLDMQLLPLAATALDAAGLAIGSLQAAVMEVFSRGRLTLCSDDAAEPPRVELRLLSDGRDLVRLRDGMRRIISLLGRPEVAGVVEAVFVDDRGTSMETTAADAALDAWLSSRVGDYVHAAGTCRIGRPDDPLAVVDPLGRVIGHQHLWVADASVLPSLPRANPHLTVVLVGEKVAAALRAHVAERY